MTIFVLSDGTGETADQMIKAALVQYVGDNVKINRFKNVRTEAQVKAIFEEAHSVHGLVVYTVVAEAVRGVVERMAGQSGVANKAKLNPKLAIKQVCVLP